MDSVNAKTACRITGLSYRQLDYWDRSHFIKPSLQEATGIGSARLYTFVDLVQLRVAKMLREQGLSLQKIRKCVTFLKTHAPEVEKPLAQLRLLTDGESIFVLTKDPKVMVDTLRGGQFVFSLALAEIVEEVRGKVAALGTQRTYTVAVGGKNYRVVLQPDLEDGGYIVECPALPGCASQGDTVEEALSMIRDAIRGHVAVLRKGEKAKGKQVA
jgi:predicted RNase H-like HicB family nuclease/DNA-binding transcriptional MerR regulator